MTPHSDETTPAPSRPLLRLEAEMHLAMINRIAVDRDERFLVTASEDKTARVWDLNTGELLTVLRPPVGEGIHDSKLYAVAISPDGGVVAVGGWTRFGEETGSIYLFDRASGRMAGRIAGLPEVVLYLAFSPDGRHLAATLGADKGLRLFAAGEWREVFADQSCGKAGYWVDFDPLGRLVTSSLDGYVRLYAADFRLIARVRPPGGAEPYGVDFSPDGALVAVGFGDFPAVNVLSGQDLAFLYAPGTEGVDNDLSKVAWSRDGARLYAGGRAHEGKRHFIRAWEQEGRGAHQDFPVAGNTLMDLRALSNGRVVFGSGDPSWGVVADTGEISLARWPVQPDFRAAGDSFRLSPEGDRVGFGLGMWGQQLTVFDLARRQLSFNPEIDATLLAPVLECPGLAITDWENHPAPRLNGQPLALKEYEGSRCLAIAPKGKRFVLGADWSLRCFDRKGGELWRQAAPSAVWAVNVTRDGRLAVAGYGDGTIRWHRMEDGQELLALFVTRDGKRWVLWTPQGYYAASPGGEELIGWHVNQGAEREAAFYPVSRFRERYCRSDVVERVLETLDEEKALRQANEKRGLKAQTVPALEEVLPPVVRLLETGEAFTSPKVTLRYRVETRADAPLLHLQPMINGRPADRKLSRGPGQPLDLEGEVIVTLPEEDVTVALIAENRHGYSEPFQIQLQWRGVQPLPLPAGKIRASRKPKLYILAIGVGDYLYDKKLKYSVKDAKDFVEVIARQKGALYQSVESRILPDAMGKEVLEGLEWLVRQTITSQDVVMLFLAGHGCNDYNSKYYFLPKDGKGESLIATAIHYGILKDTLNGFRGKTLCFLDTCYSENMLGEASRSKGGWIDVNQIVNDLMAAENGVVVFASSTRSQESEEDPGLANGVFTKALVEGLEGEAAGEDGQITINDLERYIVERVKALTDNRQTPIVARPKTIPDFPIAIDLRS
ncbi:MAG: caspase family protein [Magnetococcales bacterium]|nr:caspase family protein [Magnetococcales bacterium]